MLFTQPTFALFFGVVLGLHWWVLRTNRARKAMLLVASFVFYGVWDPRFLLLIWFMTLVNYGAALGIERADGTRARNWWLAITLAIDVGILGVFKYANFFLDSMESLLGGLGMEVSHVTLHITLPVGISFFTFQAMSYVIDVHRRELRAERNLGAVALYIAFFPQLVAGPIVRAIDFLPQLEVPRRLAQVAWRPAIALFVVGFFKKAVIADTIGAQIDPYWADPGAYGTSAAVLAVLGYTAQIYCDFSGYSDMAIAVAAMFGYRLPLNFDFPYFSVSLTDFWRRWHISLSSWLRDYVYIPLGGNRRGRVKTYRNLLLTMLIGGLWHGAAWTFVVWGALHGVGLAAEKWWSDRGGRRELVPAREPLAPSPIRVGTLTTFGIVCLGWVFFRARTFADAWTVIGSLVGLGAGSAVLSRWLAVYLVVAAVLHWFSAEGNIGDRIRRLPVRSFAAGLGVTSAVMLALQPVGSAPFIYFQF